jgi:hypothetical protein
LFILLSGLLTYVSEKTAGSSELDILPLRLPDGPAAYLGRDWGSRPTWGFRLRSCTPFRVGGARVGCSIFEHPGNHCIGVFRTRTHPI